jgi:hypothetical protein
MSPDTTTAVSVLVKTAKAGCIELSFGRERVDAAAFSLGLLASGTISVSEALSSLDEEIQKCWERIENDNHCPHPQSSAVDSHRYLNTIYDVLRLDTFGEV